MTENAAVCAMCSVPVSPADEWVFWREGATGLILFCEACYRMREAGKMTPDGNVQLSLFEGEEEDEERG